MRKIGIILAGILLLLTGLTACSDTDVASKNLSKDADNFKIARRITFVNGITDSYLLTVEGYCSLGNDDSAYTTVTCKRDDGTYVKDFLLRSDNVTVVVEQLVGASVSTTHYKVVWKPSTIIPDIEVR